MAGLAVMLCSTALGEETASQGTLTVKGRKFVFKYVVAMRGESYKEPRIVILATGQKVSSDVIAKVNKIDAEENSDVLIEQPYLKAVFLENGELRCLIGKGGGMSFFNRQKPLEGKGTIQNGRIKGEVKIVQEGDFAKEASLVFDVRIGGDTEPSDAPMKLAPPVAASVKGKFTGEGKEGNLKFVSVQMEEPFNDKEAIALVFTELDHSKSAKPGFDAGFGKFGNALLLRVHVHDGGIFGCEVAHRAHSKSPFSSLGEIRMQEFDLAGGNLKGHVSTGGVVDAFDQKWEVDIQFAAPLPEKMRQAMAAPKPAKPKVESNPKSAPKMKKSAPGPLAHKLTLPADATNVEYKKLVEHITFESKLPVRDVANAFSATLQEQGWVEASGGVIGQKNAILKRKQGEAELTIMIQPKGTGSATKVFTKGLDWSGVEKKKPTKAPNLDELDDETKNLIEKTLEGDEKGFEKAAEDLINKALQENDN